MQNTNTLIKKPDGLFNRVFKRKSENGRPEKMTKAVVTTLAGDGKPGLLDGPASTARFKSPLDIAVIDDGAVYVADGFNSCIRKIINGDVTTFAGNGNANIRNGIGAEARFKLPCRLSPDPDGNLYVLDAADPRVRRITPDAEVSTYAGLSTFGCKDGDISSAQFGQSFGIITDAQKNIYIADSENDCIRKINPNGQVTTIAGAGSNGLLPENAGTGKFRFLKGLVIDTAGNLFVADFNRIRKITPAGIISTFAGRKVNSSPDELSKTIQFSQIEDMVRDDQGNIYFTEANRILGIAPNGTVSIVAGGPAGYQDGDGATARFNGPKGLGIDKYGNIYVADSHNNVIRKIIIE